MEESRMRLRWDDYTFYNGKETMLYRDGVINQLVIPINNKDMMDDKCIKDQWGYYIRPVTPDEIGDIYSVRPYAIYKGRKVELRGSKLFEKMAIAPTDMDNTDYNETMKVLGIQHEYNGEDTIFVPAKDLDFYERVEYCDRYEYFKGIYEPYKVEDYHVIIKDGELHRHKVE